MFEQHTITPLPSSATRNATHNDVSREYVQNTEAQNYRSVRNIITIQTVLSNDDGIDTMLFCDALE